MRNLTIRNVPDDLAVALEKEKSRRKGSLNRTVIELLSQGLGVGSSRSNGLARLAGTWTDEEFRQFEESIATLEEIDAELWR
jgi:plasmid stability protein